MEPGAKKYAGVPSHTIDNITSEEANSTESRQSDPYVTLKDVLGSYWASSIVETLENKPYRFNELKYGVGGISSKTLSLNLKKLVENGMVRRQVLSTRPARVSYELTEKGKDVVEVIGKIHAVEKKWEKKGK